MAIKPAINPGVGVAERPASISGAMNFISGGSPLGTSIVASAANKIVGFQRGAAAVAPQTPDLGSIIKTLSTNILNNVENRTQSINNNVQQFIQKTFQGQLGEYRQKLQSVDGDVPNRFLENFISLYKNAIGYIQFLGNRKNVKQLGDNLKALQEVFRETFQVVKTIRQTIIRIVEQLSNLPKAAPGGSGIDIDVNVPGGPLRKSAPTKGSMLKMIGMAGLAGGGAALGTKVVSGMMDVSGNQVDSVQTQSGEGLNGPMLERFNAILDRFDKAIQNLTSKGGQSSTAKSGASGITKSEPPPTAPPAGGGPAPTGGGTPAGPSSNLVSGAQGFMDMGFSKKSAAYLSGNVQQESSWRGQRDPWVLDDGAGTNKGLVSWNKSRITDAEKFLGKPLNKATNEEQMKFMQHELKTVPQYSEANKIFNDPNASDADLKRASKIYLGYGDSAAHAEQGRFAYARSALQGLGGYTPGSRGVAGKPGTPGAPGVSGTPGTSAQPTSAVAAATTRSTTQQQLAQQVSRPPTTPSKTQVNVVPMNMSSPQAQSTPVGSQVPGPPILSKGGASTPFFTSTNHDNFLTLYSKIVYNLVD